MEAIKHQQGTSKKCISLSFFLKRATKFLLSVSIFSSIIFSCSFYSYVLQSFAHNIDKRYMFLLCNGIVAFIVKNSAGLIHESQQGSADDLMEKKAVTKTHNNQPEVVKLSEEKQSIIEIKEVDQEAKEAENWPSSVMVCAEEYKEEEQQQGNEVLIMAPEDFDQEDGTGLLSIEELNKKAENWPSSVMVCAEEYKEEEQQQANEVLIKAPEDYDQEDGTGLLSIEELNKKCDDFIRKMKEEIKFGAQQQINVLRLC